MPAAFSIRRPEEVSAAMAACLWPSESCPRGEPLPSAAASAAASAAVSAIGAAAAPVTAAGLSSAGSVSGSAACAGAAVPPAAGASPPPGSTPVHAVPPASVLSVSPDLVSSSPAGTDAAPAPCLSSSSAAAAVVAAPPLSAARAATAGSIQADRTARIKSSLSSCRVQCLPARRRAWKRPPPDVPFFIKDPPLDMLIRCACLAGTDNRQKTGTKESPSFLSCYSHPERKSTNPPVFRRFRAAAAEIRRIPPSRLKMSCRHRSFLSVFREKQ